MAFHNVRLPEDVERGARGGPRFKTGIIPLSSGWEKRNIDWERQRGEWNIGYGMQYKEDYEVVTSFFYIRRGRAHSFRFKDWTDFEIGQAGVIASRQSIGVANGVNKDFQIFKRYEDAADFYDRKITRVVSGTLEVYVNGVLQVGGYAETLGLITFTSAPTDTHVVSVICQFDVPVRFDQDELDIQAETFEAGAIPDVKVIELKE